MSPRQARPPKPGKVRRVRPPPTTRQPSGIDVALISEIYDEEVDATIREGLRSALTLARDEIPNGGPLIDYVAVMRKKAIAAIRDLPNIDPSDLKKFVELQQVVGDYLRPMQYIIDLFSVFAAEAGRESGQETGEELANDDD